MAVSPKLRKVLVDTRFGPAYRYVQEDNLQKRYGKVGTRKGEKVLAKKRTVEYAKVGGVGQIQRRAIAAKDLEEKYSREYVPGVGYIWVKQEPAISSLPDDRDMDKEAQERIESTPPAAQSRDLETIIPVSETRGTTTRITLIPSAVDQAQAEERQRRQEAQPTPEIYLPDEKRDVPITAIYKSQGVPYFDDQGNPVLDEEGNQLKILTRFHKASDVPLLYEPAMTSSGTQQRDNRGRPVYIRKKMITSVPVAEPSQTASRVARPIPGGDVQRIVHGTFTDENDKKYEVTGYPSTINGKYKRLQRGEDGYGGTGDEADKDMEAITSMKKKLVDMGVSYDNIDKYIRQAIERGDLVFEYRRFAY